MSPARRFTLRGSANWCFCYVLLWLLIFPPSSEAYPQKLGDLDEDGVPTVIDLARIVNHITGSSRLSNEMAVFADLNQDGVVNDLDADIVVDVILGFTSLPDLPLTQILDSSPVDGEDEVSVTRETIIRFTQPLSTNTLPTPQNFYAEFGGQKLVARPEFALDRRTLTLFYAYPLPGSARVRVTLNGNSFTDFAGRPIDADGDGQPGGVAIIEFDTLSLTPFPNTIVCGRVFASQLAVQTNGGTNMSVNTPLRGVTITADGLEQQVRAVTDQNGNFRLTNAPAGHFFVHVDGRTVTNLAAGIRWPDLSYYPYVGKEWESIPGGETNIGEVFLPLVSVGTLHPVSPTNDTIVTFPNNVLADHPELQGVTVTVPANALFSDNGNRGGMVGIAPVPPDRLPGPLPSGLNFPLVITLQTDGPSNFGQPVPVCFPNLTNTITGQPPLPPGAKSALWSFNHDTGDWEVIGPMTVSEDGRLVCSDAGVGILAPGWHGTAPGTPGGGGEDCPTCQPPTDPAGEKCNLDDPGCGTPETCPLPMKTNPILLYSGEKYEQVTDLRIKGVGMDFVWARSYSSRVGPNTAQGNAWDFSYNEFLLQSGSTLRFCNGAGRDDTYLPFAGQTNVWVHNGFFQEILFTNGNYTMEMSDKRKLNFLPFDGSPAAGRIASIVDRNGNTLQFTYDALGRLANITDTLNRNLTLAYNADGFIETLTDFAGRSVRYNYYGPNETGGSFGDLKSVTTPAVTGTPNGNDFPNGKTTTYTYSKGFADDRLNHNLLSITDGRDSNYLVNIYSTSTDSSNINFDRVVRQVRGGDTIDLTYVAQTPSADNNQAVLKVILNDGVGNVSEHFYDVGSRLVLLREYTGRAIADQPTTETSNRPINPLRASDPPYFETRYDYNLDYKQTRIAHPNGNITEMIYEADLNPATASARTRGNLRVVRHLPGTHVTAGDQGIITEQYEYDTSFGCSACGFNFVTKHTDARGNVTLSEYDQRGNLTNRVHRIATITEQFAYNSRGQMTNHVLPDSGNGHRRVDAYTYYESGPQRGYLQAETIDAGGFNLTTQYEYNPAGVVTRKIDPSGHDHQYVVNQLDQVVREISPEVVDGSGVRYTKDHFYDANNNLVRVETENRTDMESGGGIVATNPTWTTTFEYEILNHLVRKSEEVEPGRSVVSAFAYDGNRNRTLTRYGEATAGRQTNNVVQMLYDERDLPFREIRAPGSPEQSTIQSDYDGNRNRIRVWQGLEDDPHLTIHSFDSFNRVVSMADAMGNVTTNKYDANGNRINTAIFGELIDGPGGSANMRLSQTAFFFDPMNRLTNQSVAFFNATNQAPIGDGLATTQTIYSDNSQVLAVINDNNHGTTNRYDTANRLSVVTDAKGNTITYTYDSDSNVSGMLEAEKSDLDGHVENFTTTFGYDGLNRLASITDNIGNLNRSGYDSRNNRTVTIDALTNKVLYAYDGLNRLTQTTRLMTQDGTGTTPVTGQIVTRQTWDDTSRLTSQIDDNTNATTYLYDGLSRKFATVYADSTGQTNAFDVHDNTVRFTDANGNIVTNRYDLLNRVTNKLVSVGPTVAATTTFEQFQYDGLSRLVSTSNDVSLVTRSYNSLGHVTREVQGLTNSLPAAVGSVYDGVGNLTQLTYPGGHVVTTTYDELERKKIISDTNGMIATYFFVGPQRVTRRHYGNGTRCDYSYDGITGIPNAVNDFGVKRMTRTRHFRIADTNVIDDRTFTWDRAANKTENKDVRAGGFQWRRDYGYDTAYRLIHSMKNASTGTVENITYDLDGVGNRRSVTGGPHPGDYAMDATLPEPADRQLNQYTATSFDNRLNDPNGNLIAINPSQATQRNLTYDYRNRMVAYTDMATGFYATFTYDVLGRRVQKGSSGGPLQTTRLIYYDWQEIEEQDGLGVIEATYVLGIHLDETLSMLRGTEASFFHSDELYTVMALTDTAGILTERYEYDVFGSPSFFDPSGGSLGQTAVTNAFLFAGRRFDTETKYYDLRTRYLETFTGRFTARDSQGNWGDMLNLGNPFAYVANSPGTYTDPWGMGGCAARREPEKEPKKECTTDRTYIDEQGCTVTEKTCTEGDKTTKTKNKSCPSKREDCTDPNKCITCSGPKDPRCN